MSNNIHDLVIDVRTNFDGFCDISVNNAYIETLFCGSEVSFRGNNNKGTLHVFGSDLSISGIDNNLQVFIEEGDNIHIKDKGNDISVEKIKESLEYILLKDHLGNRYSIDDKKKFMELVPESRILELEDIRTNLYSKKENYDFIFSQLWLGPTSGDSEEIRQLNRLREGQNARLIRVIRKKDGRDIGDVTLYADPLFQASVSTLTRTVYISAAADEEFRRRYGFLWKQQIQNYFEFVSENYRENFGITFNIAEYLPFDSDDSLESCHSFFNDLRKNNSYNGDILVAFTRQRISGCGGMANYCISPQKAREMAKKGIIYLGDEGCYSLIVELNSKCPEKVIAHEIGHNFELGHVDDPRSIMYPGGCGCQTEWDDYSREKMLENKWKMFK